MTAFTRQERSGSWGILTLELRSVNHRYLELAPRLPEELRPLEPKYREILSSRLKRGKIDCNLRLQSSNAIDNKLLVNQQLAAYVVQICRDIDHLMKNPGPINSLDVLKWPGVLQPPEIDMEQLSAEALTLLDEGLTDLCATRAREGVRLKKFIQQRCTKVQQVVEKVHKCLPEILQAQRKKLISRLQELQTDLNESRLEQEIVYLAQKMDVHEELDRLTAHLEEVQHVLGEEQPVGRRLDFLMQEFNREANTLGSKSVDSETTRASVDLKVLIEQMREQVQNIE